LNKIKNKKKISFNTARIRNVIEFFLKNKVYPYKRLKKWIKLFKFKCIKNHHFSKKIKEKTSDNLNIILKNREKIINKKIKIKVREKNFKTHFSIYFDSKHSQNTPRIMTSLFMTSKKNQNQLGLIFCSFHKL
jgi:hypothetical protein